MPPILPFFLLLAFAACGDGEDWMKEDEDNDGISNKDEGAIQPTDDQAGGYEGRTIYGNHATIKGRDTDGDGIPDFRDDDSDGDGIPDKDEVETSATRNEHDGSLETVFKDSDGDGIADHLDHEKDTDGDGDFDNFDTTHPDYVATPSFDITNNEPQTNAPEQSEPTTGDQLPEDSPKTIPLTTFKAVEFAINQTQSPHQTGNQSNSGTPSTDNTADAPTEEDLVTLLTDTGNVNNFLNIPPEASSGENTPPTVQFIVPALTPEGFQLSFPVIALDTDSNPAEIRFSLLSLDGTTFPEGAMIDSVTGLFTWTPTEAHGPGDYGFRVSVNDGDGGITVVPVPSLQVLEVNQAPTLGSIDDQNIPENAPLSLQIMPTDDDLPANNLTYSLGVGAPIGLNINQSGLITWTPGENEGGKSYTFDVIVDDGTGTPNSSVTSSISIDVAETNQAPVLAPIGNQGTQEGTSLGVPLSASDADLPVNTLSFSLVSAPNEISIDAATNTLNVAATLAAGDYTFDVVVDDGTGAVNASDSETITVTVAEIPGALLIYDFNNPDDTALPPRNLFELDNTNSTPDTFDDQITIRNHPDINGDGVLDICDLDLSLSFTVNGAYGLQINNPNAMIFIGAGGLTLPVMQGTLVPFAIDFTDDGNIDLNVTVVLGTSSDDIALEGILNESSIIYGFDGLDDIAGDQLSIDSITGVGSSIFMGGNDIIHGGNGPDRIFGDLEAYDDTATVDLDEFQGGNDKLYGEEGSNSIFGDMETHGKEITTFRGGDDLLVAGPDGDFLVGDLNDLDDTIETFYGGRDIFITGAGNDRMAGDVAFPTPDITTFMGATDEFVFNLDSDNSGSVDGDDNFGNDTILDVNAGDVPDILVFQNVPGGTFEDFMKISQFVEDSTTGDATLEVYSFDITAGTSGASPIGTIHFEGISFPTARLQPSAALASTTGVAAQLINLDNKTYDFLDPDPVGSERQHPIFDPATERITLLNTPDTDGDGLASLGDLDNALSLGFTPSGSYRFEITGSFIGAGAFTALPVTANTRIVYNVSQDEDPTTFTPFDVILGTTGGEDVIGAEGSDELIFGLGGMDSLFGDGVELDVESVLSFNGGDDILVGEGSDASTLVGDLGNNFAEVANFLGGNDTIRGGNVMSTLVGDLFSNENEITQFTGGNDRVIGGLQGDILVGDIGGNDDGTIGTFVGGNDLLEGRKGDDDLIGDIAEEGDITSFTGGRDTFIFNLDPNGDGIDSNDNFGNDTIWDWNAGGTADTLRFLNVPDVGNGGTFADLQLISRIVDDGAGNAQLEIFDRDLTGLEDPNDDANLIGTITFSGLETARARLVTDTGPEGVHARVELNGLGLFVYDFDEPDNLGSQRDLMGFDVNGTTTVPETTDDQITVQNIPDSLGAIGPDIDDLDAALDFSITDGDSYRLEIRGSFIGAGVFSDITPAANTMVNFDLDAEADGVIDSTIPVLLGTNNSDIDSTKLEG